ncbi:glycosyltransferase [Vibrio vulnificus]|uniref:glycosyltransferase n=1 Tax=Vibrio vulnificus TaxID=672 RepID=UPI001EEC31F4|nr:glycosyltransferase [Vibrio vulnificus]EJV9414803.1 glycosyltransferase [Vibrio vulnificus]MCG6296257.1 glycosyltransferase [Vibrio vulnificus]MCU8396701.1 glycosyltransferase [Vibrio vulnificus]
MINVSVVVPIYNGEQYLRECLDSIRNQSLTTIEILCIDDGSTDRSKEIIKEIQLKDPRVKYFRQKNLGVSDARNFGLFKAVGEYVQFIDQDDLICVDMLETLYYAAKKNALDIVSCDISFFGLDSTLDFHMPIPKEVVLDFTTESVHIVEYLRSFFSKSSGQGAIWNKLYKRDILLNSNRFVSRKLVKSEDTVFSFLILTSAERVMFLSDTFYKYRVRRGSQSRVKSKYELDLTLNMIDFIWANVDSSNIWLLELIKEIYTEYVAFSCVMLVIRSQDFSFLEKISAIRRIFSNDKFCSEKANFLSIKKKFLFYLYRLNLSVLIPLLFLLHKNEVKTHLDMVYPYD